MKEIIQMATITGTNSDDSLSGGAGADAIIGLDGNDTLDGGAGNDSLTGGAGDDTYYVDGLGDRVTESAGNGIDIVYSSGDFSINDTTPAVGVENLTLTGSGNTFATGNAGNNIITGNSGNNTLDGRGGTDTLIGGTGDDTFTVDTTTDTITENSGEGTDTVSSIVTFSIAGFANIENLTLAGSGAKDGTGNGLDNLITSVSTNSAAHNSITGDAGNDTIEGKGGADTLNGGTGDDSLMGGAQDDTYTGYSGSFGADIIDDASGSETVDISSFATNGVTWSAVDTDSDTFVDKLLIDFGSGNTISILHYFSDTTTDDDTSSAGAGCIEHFVCSDDGDVTFANVQALIA
jgi:Ca2+-binding RTX toxin-like protein